MERIIEPLLSGAMLVTALVERNKVAAIASAFALFLSVRPIPSPGPRLWTPDVSADFDFPG
jgi:hypothetical protein